MLAQRGKGGRIIVEKGTYEHLCACYGEECWVCGSKPKTRRLHIDHDHKTLRIRGLLCFPCNRKLSKGVTAEWCRWAADYLEMKEL